MKDKSPRSLGRDFFILAKQGSYQPKEQDQDQSKAAKDKRRAAREAAKKAQGKSRYSETN